MKFKFYFYCSTSKGKGGRLSEAIHPIVLSDFLFKMITKIISEHLGTITSRVILPSLFVLVKGRQIQDAIVMASYCVNCLHKRSYGGNVALNIDIRKAFDTVSWYCLGGSRGFWFLFHFQRLDCFYF